MLVFDGICSLLLVLFVCYRNERCIGKVKFGRGNYKLSLLLFNDVYNPIEYEVFFGAINEDKFNDFVTNKLAKHINPYPGKRSLILIDNCRFHHNETFENFI